MYVPFFLRRLVSLYFLRKNKFAKALATLGAHSSSASMLLWIFYSLRMYETVVSIQPLEASWRVCFVRAISLAACGNYQEAGYEVDLFLKRYKAKNQLIKLADAIAPFMPEQALRLLTLVEDKPPSLYVGLLLRIGSNDAARSVLASLPESIFKVEPELSLFETNVVGGSPSVQIVRLNTFLNAYSVPPLSLCHQERPPSPMNVRVAELAPAVSGPLVSVLMTTFRTGERAEVAIQSILNQSYTNLELIVVDDASADDSVSRLKALSQQGERVRIVSLPRNVGTYVAKLIGLSIASGEFITCHDSDDWSHPEKIARQVQPLLNDTSLVASVSSWVRMQDDGVYYARPVHPLMRLNPSSLLFRRERILREVGAWDPVRTGADSELIARLRAVYGPKAIYKVRQPLSLGSHRPDSLMTAASTGYVENGMPSQRLAYWEAWSHWHIRELAAGRRPYIDPDVSISIKQRAFEVPDALCVNPDDVLVSLESVRGN